MKLIDYIAQKEQAAQREAARFASPQSHMPDWMRTGVNAVFGQPFGEAMPQNDYTDALEGYYEQNPQNRPSPTAQDIEAHRNALRGVQRQQMTHPLAGMAFRR